MSDWECVGVPTGERVPHRQCFPHIADRACATSILDKARATCDFTMRHAIFQAQVTTTSLQQALLIQGRLLLGVRGLGTAPSRGFRVQGRVTPRKQGGV